MKVKKTRYLIPLLILTIIITFSSFSCSTSGPAGQPIEEPAQETTEENSIKESEEAAEEEIVTEEPIKPNSRQNPATLGEIFSVSMDGVTIEIEMTEVVSGDKAWKMVKEACSANDEPGEGKEYILAKFRIKVIETEEINHFHRLNVHYSASYLLF